MCNGSLCWVQVESAAEELRVREEAACAKEAEVRGALAEVWLLHWWLMFKVEPCDAVVALTSQTDQKPTPACVSRVCYLCTRRTRERLHR